MFDDKEITSEQYVSHLPESERKSVQGIGKGIREAGLYSIYKVYQNFNNSLFGRSPINQLSTVQPIDNSVVVD